MNARSAPSQVMLMVLLAALPGASAQVFHFGWGVVLNLAWLVLLALALEAALLRARRRPVRAGLRDCSALVTATLLALALPPTAPWWLGLAGIAIALGAAKHAYGGTGRNLLNPAMAGYAVLLLLFPLQMTRWLLPEGLSPALPAFAEAVQIFLGREPDAGIDVFTGATALDGFRQQRGGPLFSEFVNAAPLFGNVAGLGWEWINAGFLGGGLYLVYRRVIAWHIPATMLAALFLWALVFHDGGSSASHGSPLFHLFGGGTMLAAFFIATDPVTAPNGRAARLAYGALIGSLVFAFRAWSAYPDGVAFAVLLANLAAEPLDSWLTSGRKRFAPTRPWNVTVAALLGLALLVIGSDVVRALRRPDAERAALEAVMPASLHDNDLAAAGFSIDPANTAFSSVELLGLPQARTGYRAMLGGQTSGIVLPVVAAEGYGGPIELLVGIDREGVITGVRAVHHSETRGLGDAIEPGRSRWIFGFDNRSLANTDEVLWTIKQDGGDFDQFAGATVTPRATVDAVHNALLFFAANTDLLLQ